MINKEKIIIAISESDKKIYNKFIKVVLILNIFMLLIIPVLQLMILPVLIILIVILYGFANNVKIEIENSTITKTNIFNKKKVIGNMSQITNYTEENYIITVLSANKELFSFPIHGREDNKRFYEYLKNNYDFSIYITGSKISGILVMIGAFLLIGALLVHIKYVFIILLGIILLCIGLDEYFLKFQLIENHIIYKRLFVNKNIKTHELTKIKYKKVTGSYHGVKSTTYTIIGYNNDLRIFKLSGVTQQKFKKIKEYCKEKNIKVKIK